MIVIVTIFVIYSITNSSSANSFCNRRVIDPIFYKVYHSNRNNGQVKDLFNMSHFN